MFALGTGLGLQFYNKTVGGGGSPVVVGTAVPATSRTTANRDRNTNKAAFILDYPTAVPGYAFSNLVFHWTFTDQTGFHYLQGTPELIDIQSDGSASYMVTVNLRIEDGATGNILNADGSIMGVGKGFVSGQTILTVTSNSAASIWNVTKSGAAIVATGSTNYYANESTGNNSNDGLTVGTAKATLLGILNTYRADNQVWSVGSGTYLMPGTIPSGGRTNFEVSPAVGVTPILNFTGGSRWDAGTGSNDHRFVGFRCTSPTETQYAYTLGAEGSTGSSHITMRNVDSDMCDSSVISSNLDGLYVINNILTAGRYVYFANARSRWVAFVGNTCNTFTATTVPGGGETQLRFYNHIGFVMRNNAHAMSRSDKPMYRIITTPIGSTNGPSWSEDGLSTSRSGCIRNNTGLNVFQSTSASPIGISWDDGTGAVGCQHKRYIFENNDLQSVGGGYIVNILTNPESVSDVITRNNVLGRDHGSGVINATQGGYQLEDTTGVRLRILAVHNDIINLLNASDWSTQQYVRGFNGSVDVNTTGAISYANLLIYNVANPDGDGILTWRGPRTSFPASWAAGRNRYIKTDSYGSSASLQTCFQVDETGFRQQGLYISDAQETATTGYTITDATLRSTHYDFTTYRTRTTASWFSGTPRHASCRYDYLGNVRVVSTTSGRYDPSGTANPLATP